MGNRLVNVVITRDEHGLQDALNGFDPSRFKVSACGTITVRPVPPNAILERLFGMLGSFDFVVFTSQHAVIETMSHLQRLGLGREHFGKACICAVGPVTAQKLAAFGITPQVMPSKFTAIALAELFPTMRCHSPKVLFLRGNWASPVIPAELTIKGYQVTSAVIYETSLRENLDAEAERLIANGEADCIAFTSPSSVVALSSLIAGGNVARLVSGQTAIASIGPTTSAACSEAGLRVAIQPDSYTLRGLADAISRHFGPGSATIGH